MSAARVVARSRGFELPLVRVLPERAPGLGRERGRPLHTPRDAARVLAPFLDAAPPTHRLAAALLDARRRLLAVALLDGGEWRACCLRPSEVYAPAFVAGATSLYLAHRHPSKKPWAVRADCASLAHVWHMGPALGLHVHDHLIFDSGGRYASLRASQEAWSGWVFRSLTQRQPLPVCASSLGDAEAEAKPATGALSARAERVPRLRPGRARGSVFTLVGLRARLVYDETRVPLDDRPLVLTHLDVATELGLCLERHRGALLAGLIDRAKRLFAVARLSGDGGGCACERVAPEALYRAAIACGAHAVFLAHGHAARGPEVVDADTSWTARAYELGRELGLELRDHLIFAWDRGFDGGYLSLRQRSLGADDWRGGDDLAATPVRMRLHQAHANRRPQRPALTRSLSARAALRRCTACGRRSAIKAACPWCSAPRGSTPGDTRRERTAA